MAHKRSGIKILIATITIAMVSAVAIFFINRFSENQMPNNVIAQTRDFTLTSDSLVFSIDGNTQVIRPSDLVTTPHHEHAHFTSTEPIIDAVYCQAMNALDTCKLTASDVFWAVAATQPQRASETLLALARKHMIDEWWVAAAWQLFLTTGNYRALMSHYIYASEWAIAQKRNWYDSLQQFYHNTPQRGDTSAEPQRLEAMGLMQNVLMCHALTCLSEMSQALDIDNATWAEDAVALREGINQVLWNNDAGYYYSALLPDSSLINDPDSSEAQALAIILGIAEEDMAERIVANYPMNSSVCPIWATAAAIVGNINAYRRAIGTTIYEFCTAGNIKPALTVGNILRAILGLDWKITGIEISPLIAQGFGTMHTITHLPYRASMIDITIYGHGNTVKEANIDSKTSRDNFFPATLAIVHNNMNLHLTGDLDTHQALQQVTIATASSLPRILAEHDLKIKSDSIATFAFESPLSTTIKVDSAGVYCLHLEHIQTIAPAQYRLSVNTHSSGIFTIPPTNLTSTDSITNVTTADSHRIRVELLKGDNSITLTPMGADATVQPKAVVVTRPHIQQNSTF